MAQPLFRTIGDDRENSVPRNADPSGITPTQDRRTGRPCGQRSARCAAESFPTATSMDFQENIAVEPVPIRAGRRERAALENKVIGVQVQDPVRLALYLYHKGFKSNIESDEYPNHQGNTAVVGFG